MLRKCFLWFYVINYVGTNEKILHGDKILTPTYHRHHGSHPDLPLLADKGQHDVNTHDIID